MHYAPGRRYLFVDRNSTAGRFRTLTPCPELATDPRVQRVARAAYMEVVAEDDRNFHGEVLEVDHRGQVLTALDVASGDVRHINAANYVQELPLALLGIDECEEASPEREADFVRRAIVQALWQSLDANGRDVLRAVLPCSAREAEEIESIKLSAAMVAA